MKSSDDDCGPWKIFFADQKDGLAPGKIIYKDRNMYHKDPLTSLR